ncbi:hypothetical protein STANM309S_04400 [Streptomyces tanashiensis]
MSPGTSRSAASWSTEVTLAAVPSAVSRVVTSNPAVRASRAMSWASFSQAIRVPGQPSYRAASTSFSPTCSESPVAMGCLL